LHITQPTLSTRIQKLEEGLGFGLINRSWNGIQLTREGYYFLPYATQLINDLSNASTVLTNNHLQDFKVSFDEVTNTNRLYIGIDPWLVPLFIKPLLAEIRHFAPEIEYKIITRPTKALLDLIEYNIIQLGIFYQDESHPNNHIQLTQDEMVLLYCSDLFADIKDDLSNIDILKSVPFLLFDNPVLVYHSKFTSQVISKFGITRFHIIDDINVMMNMVATGSGFTVIPKSSIYQFNTDFKHHSLPVGVINLRDRVDKINIQAACARSSSFPVEQIALKLQSIFQ